MKLFTRKTSVPKQTRPDYDAIKQMEREFKLDDKGFDERYDEMLITEFKRLWGMEQWTPDQIEEKIYELIDSLYSEEAYMRMYAVLEEVREERKWLMEDFEEDCQNLRDRMIVRGRLAMNKKRG